MAKMMIALLFVLLGSASPSYQLDASASQVSAKVGFLGLSSKTANFPEMSGSIRIDPSDTAKIDLRVDLDARALTAPDNATQKRLKGEDYFWVERHPTVSFRGTRLLMEDDHSGQVEGSVTARGVQKPVTLVVRFSRPLDEVIDGRSVTINAATTIDRRDFGMTSHRMFVGKKVDISITARMIPQG